MHMEHKENYKHVEEEELCIEEEEEEELHRASSSSGFISFTGFHLLKVHAE